MIPEPIVDEVRVRADIVEVIGEQIQLKRSGKDFKALCPFHTEKTPSFYVVPGKGSGFYKCFGCGESGDVFTFLMKRAGLSFQEAVQELARRVGVEIPEQGADRRDEPHRVLYEALAFADDLYRRELRDSETGAAARKYVSARGITPEAVERFGLGYAPAGWSRLREAAKHHGITDEVLLEAGLTKIGEHSDEPYDRLRDRLIFPIQDLGGRTIGFGGRIMSNASPTAPKYLNSPETPVYHKGRGLYGLNWSKGAIRREGVALVVEGYMDYVTLAARGIEHVVAALGTAMTEEQANLLGRYTGRAVLLYDSDGAGSRATFRTGDALLRAGVHPLAVSLPAGEDPDSVTRQGGAAALKRYIEEAVDVLERKLQILDGRGFFNDIEGSRRALDHLLPTLRATVDPALRDIYVARVAQRTGVRRETLEAEIVAAESAETSRRRAGGPGGAAAQREPDVSGGPPPDPRVEPPQWTGYETPPADRWEARGGRGGGRGRRFGNREQRSGWPEPPTPAIPQHGAERLLLTILLADPHRIADAAAALTPAEFLDAVNREVFEALLDQRADGAEAAEGGEAELSGLSEAARRRLAELLDARAQVSDGNQSFGDAVADIKDDALYLRLATIDRQLAGASSEAKTALLREREEVSRRLRELRVRGYKGHPRLHRLARGRKTGPRTITEEEY